MSELSYTQFLELQVKEYRALLDMLREKHPEVLREWVASQQSVQADVLEWCGCEGYTPTMENGKCSACGKNAHR